MRRAFLFCLTAIAAIAQSVVGVPSSSSGSAQNGGAGAVTSVFTRTGAVTATSGDYTVGQVTGAAPLASPAFTGTPTAPTPSTSDNSTNIATTAYVQAQDYGKVTSVAGLTGAVPGGLVLVEQHTASASTALQFTTGITSSYDDYELRCQNLIPTTNGDNFEIRMSTNGGSSYDSSSIYDVLYTNIASGSVTPGLNTNQSAGGFLGNISNNANYGVSLVLHLTNPGGSTGYKYYSTEHATYYNSSTSTIYQGVYSGDYRNSTAVNAFEVIPNTNGTNTWASGTCRLYGVAKQ
jgi:hypothetical protein